MSDQGDGDGNAWGTFLRSARKAKGWSVDDLALEANVSRMTILRWEAGRRGFKHETLKQVTEALGVPFDAALALARGEEPDAPLPPPLPRELALLLDCYNGMTESDRRLLLERIMWVVEWAQPRVTTPAEQRGGKKKRTG